MIVDANEGWTAEVYAELAPQMLALGVPDDDQWNRDYVRDVPIHWSGMTGRYSPKGNVINGTMVCRRRTKISVRPNAASLR